MEDENLPQRAPARKKDLGPMSIEELHEYIDEMQKEIERVRVEISRKEAHRASVDNLFKQ